MANRQYGSTQKDKKDSRNGTNRTCQDENDLKKRAPQHTLEGKQDLWWQSSLQHEECPITLEPFATIPYPPFPLFGGDYHHETMSSTSSTLSTNQCYYFDGFALASYLVARGIFENPLTRQALTIDDCRRLDKYLEQYRPHASSPMEHESRAVSVAEAFSLQLSIQVEKMSSRSNQRSQEEARAQVLRRTATAALAGLFDYSRQNQHHRQSQRRQRQCGNQISAADNTNNQDSRLAEWGLDLSRTVEDSSGQSNTGWTIIDDDEELVTAAQRDAYEFVQRQFPRLSDRNIDCAAAHNYDESIVQTARFVAFQEEQENQKHAEAIAQAQKRLRGMALRQQEERKKQQKEEWQRGHVQWEQQQREKKELIRVRQEIDAWREEQWETLQQISEEQARSKVGCHEKKDPDVTPETSEKEVFPLETSTLHQHDDTFIKEAASNKKAKAAAKRKRAKARKQAQKAAAKAALEEKQKEEELNAKKAASAKRCDACGGGILNEGFEKFGLKFCSTKCARTAKPPDRL